MEHWSNIPPSHMVSLYEHHLAGACHLLPQRQRSCRPVRRLSLPHQHRSSLSPPLIIPVSIFESPPFFVIFRGLFPSSLASISRTCGMQNPPWHRPMPLLVLLLIPSISTAPGALWNGFFYLCFCYFFTAARQHDHKRGPVLSGHFFLQLNILRISCVLVSWVVVFLRVWFKALFYEDLLYLQGYGRS